jgi:hypothetical protein
VGSPTKPIPFLKLPLPVDQREVAVVEALVPVHVLALAVLVHVLEVVVNGFYTLAKDIEEE